MAVGEFDGESGLVWERKRAAVFVEVLHLGFEAVVSEGEEVGLGSAKDKREG